MTNDPIVESSEDESNLIDFLTARARSASDARLALGVGIGVAIAVIALLWRVPGWHLIVSASLCFMGFGGWGIADRELRERIGAGSSSIGGLGALRLTRVMSAILGGLAGAALLISLLGLALGTWI